ncbi:MAG: hypothetical protein ACLURQ_00810 [Bacteroides thetaiotaomicron]
MTINPFYMVCYSYNGGETKISADLSSYMNGYQDPSSRNLWRYINI